MSKIKEILIDDIVVGDLVVLQVGDVIPADGYLVEGKIKVDNASLNGESEPCTKIGKEDSFNLNTIPNKEKVSGEDIVDSHSLFRGSCVIEGNGVMRVTKVGMKTMMGDMTKEINEETVQSPLKAQLSVLADYISKFGTYGAILIAIAFMIHRIVLTGSITTYISTPVGIIKDLINAVVLGVVIIVMAVPEGLPMMVSLVLSQNMKKMLDNNVLVRKLFGIETAGAINLLFSDKTGTITKGELEVVDFCDGDLRNSSKTDIMKKYITLSIAKNTGASLDDNGNIVGGNATDKALLKFVDKSLIKEYENEQIIKQQAFNSTNKFSSSQLSDFSVYKGAPEKLLLKTKKYISSIGEIKDLDVNKINEKINEYAAKSMRVLCIAYSESEIVEDTLPEDLIFIGLLAIRDDIRPEAIEAIKQVKSAGVQVVMITGDKKETAIAIAKDAGLLVDNSDIALTSEELNNMSDEEIAKILPNIRVIARAIPTDKSRMVKIAQSKGIICGMTGDGANDAPALKKADVGFAMGSGTEVAKEAGDIIILDNNFKSIEKAVLFGRTIYKNIQKFIKFQLSINVAAVIISFISPFIGIEHPLSVTQILWVNLVMDTLAALALGSEPALDKYMLEKPRSRKDNILNKDIIYSVATAGGYMTIIGLLFLKLPVFTNMFTSQTERLTAFFCIFILSAVFNGFNVRSKDCSLLEHISENKKFLYIMGIIFVVQVLLTLVGGEMFNCEPLTINQWILVLLISIFIIPIDMIRKIIFNKK